MRKHTYSILIGMLSLVLCTPLWAKTIPLGDKVVMIGNEPYVPLREVTPYLLQESNTSGLTIKKDGQVTVLKGAQETLKSIVSKGGVQYISTHFLEQAFTVEIPTKSLQAPPTITGINNLKKEYGIGEKIEVNYTYKQGDGASIVQEKWSFYKEGEPQQEDTFKPTQLFESGVYKVKLQIQDDKGSLSNEVEFKLSVNEQIVETLLHHKLTTGKVGEIINAPKPVDYLSYNDVKSTGITDIKGTLIVSNSPERIQGKYVLYQDKVEGKGRLLLHHVNGFTEEDNALENKRLMVVAKNTTDKTVTLKVKNKSIEGPHGDILLTGQKALISYFKGKKEEIYTLQPKEAVYLYDSKEEIWDSEEVISGLLDFEAIGKIQLIVATGGPGIKAEDVQTLPTAPKDGHIRGTFDTLARDYTVDLTSQVDTAKLIIGKGQEEWVTGYDALTGDAVYNAGNYGVMNGIKVKVKEETAILFNPRGGGFRGAVEWDGFYIIPLPNEGYFVNKDKAAEVGIIKEGEEKLFNYMLPNGAAAPGLFAFVPKTYWNK